jgi:hypothetical protein
MPAAAKATRGTRSFLRQVADELPMHLPPGLRDLQSEQWGRFYKVWYGDKRLHFETQFLSEGRLEIGFHMEADPETNERVAAHLERKAARIRKALGDEVKAGSHGPKWRSLAETWSGGDLRSVEAATEAAARLAQFIRTIRPLLPR